jgi:MFS family permease
VFAYANTLWLLFLSRLVQGAGGGTVSVIQAYVADAVRPEDRAKGLGWLSAATNAGVALGPVLGTVTSGLGRSGPGLAAACLCVVNIAFAWHFLSESRDMAEAKSVPTGRARSLEALTRVVTHSSEPASRLIWIYAIAIGAFRGVNAVLALFLAVRFDVTKYTIGYFFTYIALISVLTRAAILGWAVDRLGAALTVWIEFAGHRPRGDCVHVPASRSRFAGPHAPSFRFVREGVAVPAAGSRGRTPAAGNRLHFPMRDRNALTRNAKQ